VTDKTEAILKTSGHFLVLVYLKRIAKMHDQLDGKSIAQIAYDCACHHFPLSQLFITHRLLEEFE
jgi:hypothetical protein